MNSKSPLIHSLFSASPLRSQLSRLSTCSFAVLLSLVMPGVTGASDAVQAEKVLLISQQKDEKRAQQEAWAKIFFQQGVTQYERNQYHKALESWQIALSIFQEIDDQEGEAQSLRNIGSGLLVLEQYEDAITYSEQSLKVAREIGLLPIEADSLNNLGLAFDGLRQYEKAISFYENSLEIKRKLDDESGIFNSFLNLGNTYHSLFEFDQAIYFYEQSLDIARRLTDPRGEAKALGNLGNAYHSLTELDRAVEFHKKSLEILVEIGDFRGASVSLNYLGLAFNNLGQYQQALNVYAQSLKIARYFQDRHGEAEALHNMGITHDDLSNYEQAIDFHSQSLRIAREIGSRHHESAALASLGIAYDQVGQYQKAISYLKESLDVAGDTIVPGIQASALDNLGFTYKNLGQNKRAIEFHKQSLAISKYIRDRQGEATSLGNLGLNYHELRQYEKALDFYQKSLSISQEIRNRQGEAGTLGNIGRIFYEKKQYELASELFQKSLKISREINNLRFQADSLGNLGNIYLRTHQHEKAIDFYQQAITLKDEIDDQGGKAILLNSQGVALLQMKKYSDAESSLRQSITVQESLRDKLSDSQLISILDTQDYVYINLERVLEAQDKVTDALSIAEQARGRALVLKLESHLSGNQNHITGTPTVNEIQQIAHDTNTTLVTYSLIFNHHLNIYIVQPNGNIQLRSVPLSKDSDSKLSASLINNLKGPLYRNATPPSKLTNLITETRAGVVAVSQESDSTERLKDLHKLLIDPIADLLPTDPTAKVAFIPDGNLFLVPFAALQDEDGTHLIEKHTILTAPSIQVYGLANDAAATKSLSQSPQNPLVVGNPTMPTIPVANANGDFVETQLDPLYGAEAEAKAVGKTLGTKPLIGGQATEAEIKQQLPSADLIHLATHGLLQYGDPQTYGTLDFPGAIALAPSDGEDGLLTSAELLEMDLQASLAILSACDTGRGRITGDGVVGLSRSLITAGVPSVIVSLWAVPDKSTAELMTEFYQQLNQGRDKAQALRQAMLITMKKYPNNPRAWAAFTLMGSGS